MSNKKQNEELQSRREFFKKAAKAALPVIGAIAFPHIANAQVNVQYERTDCRDCTGSCRGSCATSCMSTCQGNCKGDCMGGSTNGTNATYGRSSFYCTGCTGQCSGGCTGSCYRTCQSTCSGYTWN